MAEKSEKLLIKKYFPKDREQLFSALSVIVVTIAPIVALLVCDIFKITDSEMSIKAIMNLALASVACCAFVMAYQKKLTANNALLLIIIAGLIMRMGYMLYTPWTQRGHDMGSLDANGVGHGAYIVNNILQGHLPQTNEYQFYHPPFYYFVSAMVMKIAAMFKNITDYASLIKYAAAVSCSGACVTLVVIQKLLDALKIKRKHQIPAMAIASFFPNFILMGGRINNDAFATLFMISAVYFTVRWFYDTKTRDIIFLALSIGLGMMSKVSCGIVAIFTGPIMLYKLYISFKDKKTMSIIKQLVIFALICFPLALWYPIRNYMAFSQPLSYVLDLGPGYSVYTGDVSAIKRFFSVPVFEIFKQLFMNVNEDYSIFMILSRTAVFGEFIYAGISKIIGISLYFANLIIVILSLSAMVLVCIKGKERDWFSRFSMAAIWAVTFVSYVIFNIKYPASCSADMRYLPLAFVSGIFYISALYGQYEDNSSKIKNFFLCGGGCLVASFCILSMIMYA